MNSSKNRSRLRLWLVLLTTAAAFTAAYFCLANSVYIVYQNLFYIPIILSCFWYGKRGVVYSAILSAVHIFLFALSAQENIPEEIARLAVFILIAVLVDVLAERIKKHRAAVDFLNNRLLNDLERFRRAEELAGVGVWEMDLESGQVVWSDGMYRLFGYEPGGFEPSLEKRFELTFPEDREFVRKMIGTSAQNGENSRFESRIVRADGSVRWVLSTGYREQDEYGRPRNFIGVLFDVTDRKLEEEKEKYELLRNECTVRIFTAEAESVGSLTEAILQEALKLTKSEAGILYRYDEKREKWIFGAVSSGIGERCGAGSEAFGPDDPPGVLGEALRSGRPAVRNGVEGEGAALPGLPGGSVPLSGLLCVPVSGRRRTAAALCLAKKSGGYTRLDAREAGLFLTDAWQSVQRKDAEDTLYDERERFRITIASIGDGVIATDAAGNVTLANPVAEKLTGWKQSEAVGRQLEDIFNIINENTREKAGDPVKKVIRSGLILGLANHTALISKYGTERSIADSAAPIKDSRGNVQGVVLVFRDVTEEKRRQDEIHYISYHDSLTGLYNRRFLEEELQRIDTPKNLPAAVVMGDVNGLKITNDTFGHSRGDQLLQKAAEAIQGGCRMSDTVARWGGDEFVILLPKTGRGQAETIVERIRKIGSEMKIGSMSVSVSFGCGVKEKPGGSLMEALKKAEDRMYENKMVESESMRSKLITAIVQALREKNPDEEQHSERVSVLCRRIGGAMGLSEQETARLAACGVLHDIGKIGVCEAVLNKQGKLTEREWDEIRRHPDLGYRILKSSKETAGIADCVLAHHERYDGSGYPAGLKGEEIPLFARIVSVADAYDAMTSDRAYRRALDAAYARKELLENRGTQFDPRVVDVFLSLPESGG